MTFTRIPYTTREQWLEDRRQYITATELGQLVKSTSAWHRIREEKATGQRDFHGNAKTEWGNLREAEVGEYLSTFVDTRLNPNQDILVLDGTKVSATPDMISDDGELIGEIKTSGTQIITDQQQADAYHARQVTSHPNGFPYHYWIQCQAQLLVTGAEVCVFACEVRDEDETGFIPGETRYMFIAPDLVMHERLLDTAAMFWSGDTPGPLNPEGLEALVAEKLDLEVQLAGVKQAIEELVGTEPATFDLPTATVTVTADGKSTRLDTKALTADHPEIVAHYQTTGVRKGSVRIREKKGATA